MEYVTLRNGVKMPILGYGVYQVTKEDCEQCVLDALEAGYRSIDTAQSYFNEEEVGNAIKKSGIPREDIFLTSKVWVEHYGYEAAKASVLESMRKLQVDYIDLMLLCTSPLMIITGRTGPWKICMKMVSFGLSACPTSIRTVWWTLSPSRRFRRWSTRWRPMC